MDIILKGLIGGVMTAVIAMLAKKGNTLPGIAPLFPTLGLIALYLVGSKGDTPGFREAAIAALKTIPAYLAFLLAVYWGIQRFDFRVTLLIGLGAWLVVALSTFVVPKLL